MAAVGAMGQWSVEDYMARLNYGVVALKAKRACVTEGLNHTFIMALPELKIDLTDTRKFRNDTDCDMHCATVTLICNATGT